MVQAVFCMEILFTYRIPKGTEKAFIGYFQGCFLTDPCKNMFSVGCFSAIPDTSGLKHSEGEDESL